MAIGIIGSSLFDTSREATLAKGDSLSIGSYSIQYDSVAYAQQGDNDVVRATVTVTRNGQPLGTMYPEKLYSASYDQWVSEVAIRSTPAEDLYIILGDWGHDGSATIKVLVNPLVAWIWIGGGLFMLGGLIAFWPRGVAVAEEAQAQAAAAAQAPLPVSQPVKAPVGAAQPKTTQPVTATANASPRPIVRKKARHGRRH